MFHVGTTKEKEEEEEGDFEICFAVFLLLQGIRGFTFILF
jgi:hypothetical protein